MITYSLNTQSAREAENVSNYLEESGKYIGTFTRAEKLVSKNKGTHGIGFTFQTDSKQSTRFDIWTLDKEHKPLMGKKMLDAIMTCMQVRQIAPTKGKVERYDYDTRKVNLEDAEIFADLVGKPVGLLLRKTEYEKMKNNQLTGETGWRLELFVPFQASTELTAAEVLDRKTTPQKLSGLVAMLHDKPLKNRPAQRAQAAAGSDDGYPYDTGAPAHTSSGFDDPDIPF